MRPPDFLTISLSPVTKHLQVRYGATLIILIVFACAKLVEIERLDRLRKTAIHPVRSYYKLTPKSCPTRAGKLKAATPRAMSSHSTPKNGITWPMMTQTRNIWAAIPKPRGNLGREDSGDPVAVEFGHITGPFSAGARRWTDASPRRGSGWRMSCPGVRRKTGAD